MVTRIFFFSMLLPATVVLCCIRLSYCYSHVIITTVEGWQHVRFFIPCPSFARRQPFNRLLRNEPNHFSYPFLIRLLALHLVISSRRSRVFTFSSGSTSSFRTTCNVRRCYWALEMKMKKYEEEPRFEPPTLGAVGGE